MPDSKAQNLTYIEGIRNGDSKVIQSVYTNYYQAISQLVKTKKGTDEDTHDVFQEGLVLIFQKAQNPDFNLTSSFFTYFYAVCRNIWYNKLRKKKAPMVTLDNKMLLMLKESPDLVPEEQERYFLYRKMFLKLGEDCQKVLDLFFQKISMEEIGNQMGYGSISYTKKRKFMCKKKLVELIKSDPGFQELKV